MFLETSLDHCKRYRATEEAMGAKLGAYYVLGLYITQVIHSANTEGLWWWLFSMGGS